VGGDGGWKKFFGWLVITEEGTAETQRSRRTAQRGVEGDGGDVVGWCWWRVRAGRELMVVFSRRGYDDDHDRTRMPRVQRMNTDCENTRIRFPDWRTREGSQSAFVPFGSTAF